MAGRKADDYTQLPDFERKVVSVSGVKVVDETKGIVEAFVSGIGNVDSGNDVIGEKFFQSSLDTHLKKNPKGVYAHDWSRPVSKLIETRTVAPGSPDLPTELKAAGAGGQYVKMQYNMATQAGRDAYEEVKFFGPEQEWSIGYVPIGAYVDEKSGARHLPESKWFEWSQVLFGMNPLTATVGVKAMAAKTGVEYDDALATLRKIVLGGGEKSDRALEALRDLATSSPDALGKASGDEDEDQPEDAAVDAASGKQADVAGSFEESIGAASDALTAWLATVYPPVAGAERDVYVWPVATFPDHVIACVVNYATGDREHFDFPYTLDADGSAVLGQPVPVELVTTVVAKVAAMFESEAKVGARHSAADQTMVQSIHDSAVGLGAACDAAAKVEAEPVVPQEPKITKVITTRDPQTSKTASTITVVDPASMMNELASLELAVR